MNTKSNLQHIAIAGAGLLGRLIAWRLRLQGHDITLFEAGKLQPDNTLRAAAFTAAGMIAPLSEAVVSDANVYRMGQFALQRWPQWLSDLPQANLPQQNPQLFFAKGSLLVAHPQDESELQQFENELNFVVPECRNYQWLSGHEIQTLEPDLHSHFLRGLLLQEEGHLHNREFLQQLGDELVRLNVTIYENTPVEVDPHTIRALDRTEKFDLVIDCRGLGAKTQLTQLRGVRGETLHVETSEIRLQRPVRLMHPRYQLYVVPKPNNRFIIGATQIESEDRSPVTLQSSLELGSALYTLSPAFAEARIIETDTNLRPAFMDNLPKIFCSPGLIIANGLFRHGYLLAPAVTEQVLAQVAQNHTILFPNLLQPSG
ncbi:FAD-dependent oxidoreductase [Cellvibrio sp. pealriver]|uniref:FAD-dependent oxidoreductase n=1 Tax=Cellvibrio sp. pealriver TaxID=1622269 RepID=UPI00069DB9FC|nr:FAD-dependent oxidoreductase [Cellvibrio sp. pealriver]